jgi:hypothetical protein
LACRSISNRSPMIGDVTEPLRNNRIYKRPDGSFTHW